MSRRFAPRFIIALLTGLALAACGDSETTQRKAFGDFLQARILDKQGLHVPQPTAEETKAFGVYAKDFAIILDFNEGMNKRVSGRLQQTLQAGMIRSLDELMTRRADIAGAKEGLRALRAALDEELAKADAAHAALTEPADLKAVYDKAYERTVTMPAKAFKDIFPPTDSTFQAIQDLIDYLDKHRDAIKINGGQLQAADPKLVAEVNRLIGALTSHSQEIMEAQRKLQGLINGT